MADHPDWIEALARYRDEHGHCYIWPQLSAWQSVAEALDKALSAHAAGRLDEHTAERLAALGVDWEAHGRQWWRWARRYAELLDYREAQGDANVPQKVPGLGPWLSAQRVLHRDGLLAANRKRLLEDAGVDWEPARSRARRWWQRYRELARILERSPEHRLSRQRHPRLAAWLAAQRTAHRRGRLDPERAAALEKLGMLA